MNRQALIAWTGFCAVALLVIPACQLHAQRFPGSTIPVPKSPVPAPAAQEWTVQIMWLGIDQAPNDADLGGRQTYPNAGTAKDAAIRGCDKLTALKGVAKRGVPEPFRAPGAEAFMPYYVCVLDANHYVAVFGVRK